MIRLYVLVEGQTEESFIKVVLAPSLASRSIWAVPIVVETSRDRHGIKQRGGGDWGKWRRDLIRITSQHKGPGVRFTTMFDLYGLPKGFPGLERHGTLADTKARAEYLEQALAADIGEWRLIPYLQRHEFESLVLAGLPALEKLLDEPDDREGVKALIELVQARAPEDINDGEETAPSKRLRANIISYRKTVHGPEVVQRTGLEALRKACPRFDAWITRFEGLSPQ